MGQWSTWCEYLVGCDVLINFVSPQQHRRIREKAKPSERKWDQETGDVTGDLDMDLYYDLIADASIANWRGLTPAMLEEHAAISEEDREKKFPVGEDGTIPYAKERARILLATSTSFDKFLTFYSGNLRAHEAARKAFAAKNSQPSPADTSKSTAAEAEN